MITNIRKNIMGTVSFDGQFDGMRKPQDFIVYPMKNPGKMIYVQSDNRFAEIDLEGGHVRLSRSARGIGFAGLVSATYGGQMDEDQLELLKYAIRQTASGKAGTNGIVYVDNSGASSV
jgi:hypothetical protein